MISFNEGARLIGYVRTVLKKDDRLLKRKKEEDLASMLVQEECRMPAQQPCPLPIAGGAMLLLRLCMVYYEVRGYESSGLVARGRVEFVEDIEMQRAKKPEF